MTFARISNGRVAEIVNLPDGVTVKEAFHADVAATIKPCGDHVREGWLFDGKVFSAEPAVAVNIVLIKQSMKTFIDAAAETERLKYITPGNGQAMTYQQKVTEAQALKSAASPQVSNYPILSSEVGITAETLGEVADIVLAAFAQWQQIGAAIESIRLGAKRDIDAAADEAAARAIIDAIEWPQPAL